MDSQTLQLGARALRQLDRVRQSRGQMLDQFGYGPRETPHTVLHAEAGLSVRKYGEGAGPAVLLVPAPIKKGYIWDIAPRVSVVQRWLAQGYQVYLAEWTPDADAGFGLADYADRLLFNCCAAIAADSADARPVIAGHSLGGMLAAMFACLHPDKVRALVLLEAPLHFGDGGGCFAPLIDAATDTHAIAQAFRHVPGSFLSAMSALASPQAFQWERLCDRYLSMAHPETWTTHFRVERWTHDEFALPGQLFAEVVESLYREDRFMRGTLDIGGRQIGPQQLRAPLLNVLDPRSTVIPPGAILPFHDSASSTAKRVLYYEGDVGVNLQHVGVLVGASAHARIWPAIFEWLDSET